MTHANRGRADRPNRNPSPEQIKKARGELSTTDAAKMLHTGPRTWQQWEAGDRRMHPAFYELFKLKRDNPKLFAEVK